MGFRVSLSAVSARAKRAAGGLLYNSCYSKTEGDSPPSAAGGCRLLLKGCRGETSLPDGSCAKAVAETMFGLSSFAAKLLLAVRHLAGCGCSAVAVHTSLAPVDRPRQLRVGRGF